MSLEMYKDGYTNLVNIDISDEVISAMREYHEKQGVQCDWLEMDATDLKFQDGEFDIVIDKGTMDAVLCGSKFDIPNKMLKEMYRVVKPQHSIVLVTHGSPANRKFLFEWNLKPDTAEVKYREQRLSPEVNLINILRSTGKGKSLKQIVADPVMFKECLEKWQEENKIPEVSQTGYTSLPFEHMEIEVSTKHVEQTDNLAQALIFKETEEVSQASFSKNCENKLKNQDQDDVEESNENECLKKKSVVKVEDSGYNTPRQNFCFIYLIKKL